MGIQAFARKHPFALGVLSAAGIIIFFLVAMSLQGFPVSVLVSGETLPKLVLFGTLFGALMTALAVLLGRTSQALEPKLSRYRHVIWPISIGAVALMYFFMFG